MWAQVHVCVLVWGGGWFAKSGMPVYIVGVCMQQVSTWASTGNVKSAAQCIFGPTPYDP